MRKLFKGLIAALALLMLLGFGNSAFAAYYNNASWRGGYGTSYGGEFNCWVPTPTYGWSSQRGPWYLKKESVLGPGPCGCVPKITPQTDATHVHVIEYQSVNGYGYPLCKSKLVNYDAKFANQTDYPNNFLGMEQEEVFYKWTGGSGSPTSATTSVDLYQNLRGGSWGVYQWKCDDWWFGTMYLGQASQQARPDPASDSAPFEAVKLELSCEIDDTGQKYDDDPGTESFSMLIPELYTESKQISGKWTVRWIDANGGKPLGPPAKSLKVCPGAWVRFRVEDIQDEDKRVLQGTVMKDTKDTNEWPTCDGWQPSVDGVGTGASSGVWVGDNPEEPGEPEVSHGWYIDVQMSPVEGKYIYNCNIQDIAHTLLGCPPGIKGMWNYGKYDDWTQVSDYPVRTGEHIDETAKEKILIEVRDLRPQAPKDVAGSSGCGSCGGDCGTVQVDMASGETVPPGKCLSIYVPEPLEVCHPRAYRHTQCGIEFYYYEQYDGTWRWRNYADLSTKVSISGSDATINYSNHSKMVFKRFGDNTNSLAVGTYQIVSYTDPDGQEVRYGYDSNGRLTSITEEDHIISTENFAMATENSASDTDPTSGRTYVIDRDGLQTWPERVTFPGETKPRWEYAYGKDLSAEYPVRITNYNPNTSEKTEIDYTYNENGTPRSTNNISTGLVTSTVLYDDTSKVKGVYVYNIKDEPVSTTDTSKTYKLYSRTEYSYLPAAVVVDGISCGVTKVTQYVKPGEVQVSTSDSGETLEIFSDAVPDPNDKIGKRYYYQETVGSTTKNTFLHAEETLVRDGSDEIPVKASKSYIDINSPVSNWKYGKTEKIVTGLSNINQAESFGKVSTYYYYSPDVSYDVSNQDVAPYPDNGTVPGNGKTSYVKERYPGSTEYVAGAYNYTVDDTAPDQVMTSYTMVTKTCIGDGKYVVSKNINNLDGTTAAVYEQNDSGQLVEKKNYAYVKSSSGNVFTSVTTETVKNVATTSGSKDMVTETQEESDLSAGTRNVTVKVNNVVTNISNYDSNGNLFATTDQWGGVTNYEHDYRGLTTVTTFPLIEGESEHKTTVTSYKTCCALPEWKQDENGHRTYFTYDGMGRVIKQWTDIDGQSSDDPLVEYTYNGLGQKEAVSTIVQNASGQNIIRTTTYHYDALGRVTKTVYPHEATGGELIGSEEALYDNHGRLMARKIGKESDNSVKITAYDYDERDRLVRVDDDYVGSFTLPNDPHWANTSFTADVTYNYDDYANKANHVLETVDGVTRNSDYYYDNSGRLISYTPAFPKDYGTISYTYNALGQKTSMIVPLGYGNKGKEIKYYYDNTGIQTGIDVLPCTVTSNVVPADRAPEGDTRFFYDTNQNRVKLINKAGYVYYFVYDPTSDIPAVIYEQAPAFGYQNVREPNGSLMRRDKYQRIDGPEALRLVQSRTYQFDGLGSTIALTDETGNITDRYAYDAWGNVTSHTGATEDKPGATEDNPYQYVGQLGYYNHYQESTLGLLQVGVRYYDPHQGRFTQVDPAKDGMNYYAYAANSPLTHTDPTGMTIIGDIEDTIEGWEHAMNFLREWLKGLGDTYRSYGPDTIETRQLRHSEGVQTAESMARISCKGGRFGWDTISAAVETFTTTKGILFATITQTGAYVVTWHNDCSEGKTHFHADNKAGINSFFYHLLPDKPTPGPMRNIYQHFWWDVKLSAFCRSRCCY